MKKIKPICKNCKLFLPQENLCGIVVLHEGKHIRLPVEPEDRCFYEEEWFNPITQETENFNDDVKELRMWEDDGKVRFEEPAE